MAISSVVLSRPRTILVHSVLLVLMLLACGLVPARAQGSINIKRDQLEQVKSYQARRQYMILDETPEVKDYRHARETGPTYQINIGPVPGGNAQPGTIVLTPERSTLGQAGFQSQIPAGGFARPGLAPVTLGGHAPAGDVARGGMPGGKPGGGARPLMSIAGKVAQRPAAASYGRYPSSGGNSFDSRFFNTQTKIDLHGTLLPAK